MPPHSHWRSWIGLTIMLPLLFAPVARACTVPVFRYALERWNPDPYEVIVLHRGALADNGASLANHLRQAEEGGANIRVEWIDLATRSDVDPVAFGLDEFPSAWPWMVVRFPTAAAPATVLWSGPLTTESFDAVIDSPARRELARRLATEDSAVWIWLEGRDDAETTATPQMLEDTLRRLEETVELPASSDDIDAKSEWADIAIPKQLTYSVLHLQRSDPQERVFVNMLLGTEPDLRDFTESMVFPVFGRGRALYALIGAGITAENMREACSFLAGPCSCQVKALNPGTDLLLAFDWNARIAATQLAETPPALPVVDEEWLSDLLPAHDLSTAEVPATDNSEIPPPRSSVAAVETPPASRAILSTSLWLLVLALATLAGGTAILLRGRRPAR